MNNYYCPYCNPKYQFQKKSSNGELICGICGDTLLKKPFIKVNKIIAIIASFSLLLPLIYKFVFLIKQPSFPTRRDYQTSLNSTKKISKSKIHQPLQSDLLKQE